jgi:hypothetical protein
MSIQVVAKKINKKSLILEVPSSGETINWPIDLLEEPLEVGKLMTLNLQQDSTTTPSLEKKVKPSHQVSEDEMEKRRKLLEELVN